MATLDFLKRELREKAKVMSVTSTQIPSDSQYRAGYHILKKGSTTYEDFIIPQLSKLLAPLIHSRMHISVLEIGPGPKTVLGCLSDDMRLKIKRYVSYEPNVLFASRLADGLRSTTEGGSDLPGLQREPEIHRTPFDPDSNTDSGVNDDKEKHDIVLFCHSMYTMKDKRKAIEKALRDLAEGGMIVVFHRDGSLDFKGLVCHRTASFPTGVTRVPNEDKSLDDFATFVAGFVPRDADEQAAIQLEWREVCRALGHRDGHNADTLSFDYPNIMVSFNHHSMMLPELLEKVPLAEGDQAVKNREARVHDAAAIVGPTDVGQVQECVRWALGHKVGLTVIGGGHGGQCLWPHVVAVDMSAFNNIQILEDNIAKNDDCDSDPLVLVDGGCKTGEVIRRTMEAGLMIPLGSRPSVGAGSWLQGGISHLARLHGLACDSIVGAVMVSVSLGQVLCVGNVPTQHQPVGSIHPEDGDALLWALKGAGTNFGIVLSVVFKAYPARIYSLRNWVLPLKDTTQARLKLKEFDDYFSKILDRNCSADAYLYWESDQLQLGVTMYESSTTKFTLPRADMIFGPGTETADVDGVALFDSEMYISGMHGGHGGGKTSSFKRCLLLKQISEAGTAKILIEAIEKRPGPLCYLHLLHGGGAAGTLPPDGTPFGCRDWEFACVVTGVWPRDQDGTATARAARQWVYDTAQDLLPLCSGVYGADLGPDPRDASLAAMAFGPNRPRLARLKQIWDPRNVLAYACPLPIAPMESKLIILVTGESCAGKDYCADVWVTAFTTCHPQNVTARTVSISEVAKREYSVATGADFRRLLTDRAYKEEHRPALTTFFENQVEQRPRLREDHFMDVVYGNTDVDVLFITGMRQEAPVTKLSHLLPDSRLIDIRVEASAETRAGRGGSVFDDRNRNSSAELRSAELRYQPSLIFNNDAAGNEASAEFAKENLFHFLGEDLKGLASMVRSTPDFPRPGIEFQHVLNICQQQYGIEMCTMLLQRYFPGEWHKVDKIVCCEAGGFLFASALAAVVEVPLALIREAGKLPPPTISVAKFPSHISSLMPDYKTEKRIEISRDAIRRGGSVVIVDDVLATGRTLLTVLQLLIKAGAKAGDISVMVVAEFPSHRGRELLYGYGFGGVQIRSLLVFGGS